MNQTAKTSYLKAAIITVFVVGMLAVIGGILLNGAFQSMPQTPSHDLPVKLDLGHGHKVFVSQEEYNTYQKYDRLSDTGFLIAMLAAFAFAWLKQRESQR